MSLILSDKYKPEAQASEYCGLLTCASGLYLLQVAQNQQLAAAKIVDHINQLGKLIWFFQKRICMSSQQIGFLNHFAVA